MAATTSSPASTATATHTAANPGAPGTAGVEAYEDMFKEITRKLYGEETGHLHGTPIAQVATSGHMSLPEGGDRSFTTLISDREFPNDGNKDHLFGLAALMHNGFAQPQGSVHQSAGGGGGHKTTSPNGIGDHQWNNVAPDGDLNWNASQPTAGNKPNKGAKKEGESKRSSNQGSSGGSKRYTCGSCPYTTDRRDLYTRHENIHKTEKPFHCYACLKQFNRADHVKKHFLRMHRELQYDINRTRRSGPSRSTAVNSNTTAPAPDYYAAPQQNEGPSNIYNGQVNAGGACLPTATHPNEVSLNTHHAIVQPNLPTTPQHQQQPANGHGAILANNSSAQHSHSKVKKEQPFSPTSPGSAKKKAGDKRFVCCYCPWTGADNWGLKRHLNTHTKPYVCSLCDYKAARSERLVTHVYKVHNKKSCNKCSFMADDPIHLMAHQNEAHAGDSRQGSVLKAIGNTTSSSTNHNNNHMASGNGAGSVAQNMDMFGNGFMHGSTPSWRPEGVHKKRGAERLFQYLEADGSDPEDYQKQLQMTALSRSARNTVAQDFHNAGGGGRVKTSPAEGLGGKRAASDPMAVIRALFANKGNQQTFIRDLEEFVQGLISGGGARGGSQADGGDQEQGRNKSNSTINTPPPAKRRRCSSHDHDKENNHNKRHQCGQKAAHGRPEVEVERSTDRGQLNAQMRDIFTYMAQHYGNQLKLDSENNNENCSSSSSGGNSKAMTSTDSKELERILRNNQELTVSVRTSSSSSACIKYSNGDSGVDDEEEDNHDESVLFASSSQDSTRSKRKSFVPRKIDAEPRNNLAIWNGIRDKHLSRLMSNTKSCLLCVQQRSSLNIPHHSVSSLILHKRWRHWKQRRSCDQCEAQFKLPYQLYLHKLKHNR